MNKRGFTLVEVIAVVALLAILISLAGTSFVKKYNESKREAIVIQEGQLVQSGDMVVQDYCKNPLSEGYLLQCDNYYQPYEDDNENLIIEDNTYTKYICVKDLKKLGYYSEELRYSGVDCSGVVVYKIDYETDLQKESYSVIQCGEDYITEVEDTNFYLTNFKECFDTPSGGGTGETEEEKKYLLTVNFTELTPNGMKVGTSHNENYKKGQSISIAVPEYITVDNEYTPFKHGSSQNDSNFSLNSDRTRLTGTMPEGNVVVNIVYSASTYVLTVNYKEFNDVQGNINFPSKQYTMYYGEEVEFSHESVNNFKIISPNKFTYQMEQDDHEIDVIYQQIDFNLTYNSNGGTTCSSRNVTYNSAYGTLCTPTRTGYTFNGWYLNGTQITATTTNTNYNNVTLTAKWTANKYYMIYNCNGGTPTTNYSSEHTYDETSNLASNRCAKTGYVFTGWAASNGSTYSNQQSIKNILSENNSSLTLTAQWTPLTYYVAFASNGGTGTMSRMTLRYGQVVNLTANTFTRTGYRFDGWNGSNDNSYSDKASITNLTTTHGATITMTAKWTKCGAGTYLVNNVCTACPAGKYSTGGVNSCTACPVGTYTSTTGKSSCSTCAAGSYNTGTGNTTCNSCEAGYYCTGGSHKAACVAGKYSAAGASSCTTCTAGYRCPGSSNRIQCTAGTYSSAGASSCTSCSVGTYSSAGASSCTNCNAGTYSTGGASSCTTCTAGYYCPGGTNRQQCTAGKYSGAGASSCTSCPAGKYSGAGASSCTNCNAGTYSAGGASSCTTCTAGYYCPGGTNRQQCTAGTYSSAGSSSCTACSAGYYSAAGATSCTGCAAGKYSTGGASSCTTCTAGYYCPGASNRIACPTGHTSTAGASACTKINYTITISVNNSSYGTVSSSTVSIPYGTTYTASGNKITFSNGTVVTASTKTATGYTTTFSSWSSTSGTITGATTITANFARTPIKYTFTTAVNNSSYGTVTGIISVAYGTTYTSSGVNITFSDGQKITATVKTATGYTTTFTGWSNGSGTVTGNKTITANFSRRGNNYSVIYNCNGGTPTNSYSSNHVYGTSSQLTDYECVKNGYSFTEWKDSSGNTYTNKQSVSTLVSTDGGSITLTAQWSPRTYTVTLNANGGSVSPSSITTTYNVSYNNLPTPTRTGYTFVGWFTGNAAKDSSKAYKSYPWLYYADTYSDLYNAYGYNEANLENHYNVHGKSEVRRTSQYINSDVYTTQGNQTLYAGWSPNKNTKYVVNHYKQNIDGTYSSTPSETQTLSGTTAASLSLSGLKKTYDGYGYKESKNSSGTVITSASIAADGSTVINMYYVQYYITMYYHPNGADTIKFNGTSYSDANFVSTTTQPFHWELNLSYGVPDVQNATWFYLSRSGYRTTKYWYDSNGVRISEAEAMTVKEFAQKFNLDLANGNQTLHLYAEWEKCAAGTYSNVPNNSCDACVAGYYSAAGASSCTNCNAGTYSTGGASSCTTCTAGYYCPGSSNRNQCSAGTYSSAGSSSCSSCTAGTYSSAGSSSCSTCSAGTYNSGTGNSSCTTCEAGYYCTGGTNKTVCPAGKYRTSTGGTSLSSCTTCEAGYYCTGGTNRTACPSGTNSPAGSTSSSSCVGALPGTYVAFNGSYWSWRSGSGCANHIDCNANKCNTIGTATTELYVTSISGEMVHGWLYEGHISSIGAGGKCVRGSCASVCTSTPFETKVVSGKTYVKVQLVDVNSVFRCAVNGTGC